MAQTKGIRLRNESLKVLPVDLGNAERTRIFQHNKDSHDKISSRFF
jgi:hypothetical protein